MIINPVLPHLSGGGKVLPQQKIPFSTLLEQSICRQQRMNSWCDKCGKYKSTVSHMRIIVWQLLNKLCVVVSFILSGSIWSV